MGYIWVVSYAKSAAEARKGVKKKYSFVKSIKKVKKVAKNRYELYVNA